jgi:F420-dependent oxidoreductase-like protein
MQLSIMIEGQNGLTWEHWEAVAKKVERLGFAGLYRSDHYTNMTPPDKDSLELWISLAWLASHTDRIKFGPLVSPVSFRHPTMTSRMAAAVDDLSNGRLVLGLGAGWQEREHNNYGWELLEVPKRMDRFEEGLEVISRLLHSEQPVAFEGRYYRLEDAILLPRPNRPGGPPILIGGNGEKRTLPLVARYAQEWNAVYLPADKFQHKNTRLDKLLEAQGKEPDLVRRSMMIGCVIGESEKELERRLEMIYRGRRTVEDLRGMGVIVGTGEQVLEQLKELEEIGLAEIMLQWLLLEEVDGLDYVAETLLPEFPT